MCQSAHILEPPFPFYSALWSQPLTDFPSFSSWVDQWHQLRETNLSQSGRANQSLPLATETTVQLHNGSSVFRFEIYIFQFQGKRLKWAEQTKRIWTACSCMQLYSLHFHSHIACLPSVQCFKFTVTFERHLLFAFKICSYLLVWWNFEWNFLWKHMSRGGVYFSFMLLRQCLANHAAQYKCIVSRFYDLTKRLSCLSPWGNFLS